MGIKLIFESKLYIVEKDQSTLPDDEKSPETLPNVNICDPSHDKIFRLGENSKQMCYTSNLDNIDYGTFQENER